MATDYGATGQGRNESVTFERIAVQDGQGNVSDHIIKYTRTEESLESVSDDFGAPSFNGNEVMSASITESVDEAIIESSAQNNSPQFVKFYNPKKECSVTYLGSENVGSSFSYDGSTFDTLSSEVSETLGDVKKVTVRGVVYGDTSSVTVGDASGGGTVRHEKRYSNTDYVREITTTVSFD